MDTLDKVDGNCVPGVVEVHRTVMKLFGRRKKSIISHLFAHDRPTWLDGV
jgi:hypothetical protein